VYNLQELSLKENSLKASSLIGLGFFGLPSINSRLHSLWLDDNPVCESSKTLKTCSDILINIIPSLVSINNKKYRDNTSTLDIVTILKKGDQRIDCSSNQANEKGFDNLEKEYLSALKGERENTVVF